MTDLEDLAQLAIIQDRPTHCSAGHEYTEENTRWYRQKGRLRRICRACSRMHHGFKNIYKPRASHKPASGSAAG